MAVMAFFNLYAQHYDRDKLNTVARIWGEVYLFHPSVVKSGGNPEWEKALVEFLPVLSGNLSNEEFIRSVNSNLLSKLNDPFTIVQNRNQYELIPDPSFSYNKPVAVLIDKTMISRAEDIAICLKALSNVTFIGERTQGTDGEMTKIYLPGGGETSFTGQAILFGNGDKFQSEGIKPDIQVSKSVQGIKEGKDEILEKALEFLKK